MCVSYGFDSDFIQGTRVRFGPCKNCDLFYYVKQNKIWIAKSQFNSYTTNLLLYAREQNILEMSL
jgi:hypothetical protein